jgi:hypothetical protein
MDQSVLLQPISFKSGRLPSHDNCTNSAIAIDFV